MKIAPSLKRRQFAKYAPVLIRDFVECETRNRVHPRTFTSANNALKLDPIRTHYKAFRIYCDSKANSKVQRLLGNGDGDRAGCHSNTWRRSLDCDDDRRTGVNSDRGRGACGTTR